MTTEGDKSEVVATGMSVDCPAVEETLTTEEYLFHDASRPCGRVLSCFEFRKGGKTIARATDLFPLRSFEDVEIIGATGTIYNKEGLFAQCGWFAGNNFDWFWVCIKKIRWLKVRTDLRFRRGDKCVWLGTEFGEYAMLLPREMFRDTWDDILATLAPDGLAARFQLMAPRGIRPWWWDDRWKEHWPFEKDAGSKRRASTDVEDYEASQRLPGASNGWIRMGAKGEEDQGPMRTNMHFRTQWVLRQNGGMLATHHHNNDGQWKPGAGNRKGEGQPRKIDDPVHKKDDNGLGVKHRHNSVGLRGNHRFPKSRRR